MSVTIHYALSEAGRRASLLAGGNGKAEQTVAVPTDHPLYRQALEMADVATDGSATIHLDNYLGCYRVTGTCTVSNVSGEFSDRPLTVEEAVASECSRWESIRDGVRKANDAEAAKRAAYLAADPTGPEWVWKRCYASSVWEVYQGYSDDAEMDAVRAIAKAEADRRNAAEKASEEAAKKAAAERKAAGIAKLAEWVRAHGSELARLRLEEGFESWVSEAREEYVDARANAITDCMPPADAPDGYEYDESEERKSPSVAEIKLLREVRERLGTNAEAKLMYYTYKPENDDDLAAIHRAELQVRVTCPDGYSDHRQYLIPAE